MENSRLGQYIIQKQRQALSAKGGNASRELGRKNSKDDDLVKDNQSRGIQKNRKYDEENEKKYRIVQSYEDMHKRSLDSVDKSERRRTFR